MRFLSCWYHVRRRRVFLLSVPQQWKSSCELVCLQALWFYLSKATTSGETAKEAKSGVGEDVSQCGHSGHQPLGLWFVLFLCCFGQTWNHLGQGAAFLTRQQVWLVSRGIHVKLGQFENGICRRAARWMRYQQIRLWVCFFCFTRITPPTSNPLTRL